MGKSVKYVVVTVLALCLACGLRAQGQETVSGGVRIQERDAVSDSLRLHGMDSRMPVPVFYPMFLPLDVVEDNLKWAASRPLEIDEILARDRRLILSRMIYDSGMPQFLQDLRAQNPAVYSVVAIVMGILGGAGGFLGGSPMEMLVPRPVVGGRPWFDDMIFLDPNFDPSVYYPSLLSMIRRIRRSSSRRLSGETADVGIPGQSRCGVLVVQGLRVPRPYRSPGT